MIINTVNSKFEQLTKGFFSIGKGEEVVLIIGSCRSIPYVNYFCALNNENGGKYTICFLDPFNWNFDLKDNRTDFEQVIYGLESNDALLSLLKRVDVCIHEYYGNFGMFNFNKDAEKNIYQFGLNPKIDICIPNYNDRFVLFADIVTFDAEMRKKATQDYNVIGKLSDQTEKEIFEISQRNLDKFYEVCRLSDIPEMEEYFKDNLKGKRLFHTYNHVSKEFTYFIFVKMCKKFLGIDLSEQFIRQIYQMPDMFANNYTYLTNYDVKNYGFDWGEEIKQLRDKL
jgi:hypothetical protein